MVVSSAADLWSFWNELVACDRDVAALLQVIARRAAVLVGEGAMISIVADDGVTMQQAAVHHDDERVAALMGEVLGRQGKVGEGLAGTVIAQRRSLVLSADDPEVIARMALPEYRQFHETHPVRSLLIVPLVALGESIGALGVFRSASTEPYADDDIVAVEALAERAALAVADARGQGSQLEPDDYIAMFRHSIDGVLFTRPDGRVFAANPAACEILQRSEADICELGRAGLVVGDDPRAVEAERMRVHTGRVRAEIPMIRGDGTVFIAHVASTVFADELGDLRSCVIFRDVSEQVALRDELEEANAALLRLSEEDELTGLRNRRGFMGAARQALAFADREDAAVQLIYFDVDNLKQINDEHGHATGDAALQAVAGAISSEARVIDVVSRLGGDEFVALLYGAEDDQAARVMDRIHAAIAALQGLPQVAVTCGVASRPANADTTLDDLLRHADEAMYENRRTRRSTGDP